MSLNRLAPLRVLRQGTLLAPRQFSTSQYSQNSPNNGRGAPTDSEAEPVEITESHRRDVRDSVKTPSDTRQTSNARAGAQTDSSTDFFDAPASAQSFAARISKHADVGISMDLLSSEESQGMQQKRKGPKGKGTGNRDGSDTRRPSPAAGAGRAAQGERGGRRDGRPSVGASGSRSGPRPQGGDRRTGGGERRERKDEDRPMISASAQPAKKPVARFDTSFAGLFGATSLISPARRGARDAAGSFWAKDLEAAKARKADMMRLAGSYDLRLPATPHPSTLKSSATAPERAKAIARWALAGNPTVPMRARDPGVGVVERLLR